MFEFRLYYDENGKVLCYTCEELPGENMASAIGSKTNGAVI